MSLAQTIDTEMSCPCADYCN